MHTLGSSTFFNTSEFAHSELFEDLVFVWQALDRLQDYLESQRLGVIEGDVSPNAYLINRELISIGEGTVVEPGAYIKGPCILGRNCSVRHGAYIRGNVLAGDRVVIGHATEVKGSILLDGAKAPHYAYVGDTILGNDVNLGAGVRCANLRLDRRVITVRLGEERISTGRSKLGAIIGDGAQIGCNAVANPGTLIGKDARIHPCTNVGGLVLAKETLKLNFPNT